MSSGESGDQNPSELLSSNDVDLYRYFIAFSNGILNTFGYKLPYNNKPKKLSEIHNILGPGCDFDAQAMEKQMLSSSLDVDGEIPTMKINQKKAGQQPRTYQKPNVEDLDNLKSLKWAERNVREKYYTTQYSDKLWIKNNKQRKQPEIDMNPFGDYIIHVRVHKPFRHDPKVKKSLKLTTQEDVLVLSSQTLSVLKDIIHCPNDFSTTGDTTDEPTRLSLTFAKELFPSGFFYINNTFYNDMRKLNAIDYSKVIRDWAASNPKFPKTNFKVSSMADVTFRDLQLKMGFPYLYKHLGSCEHIITFLNAKLLNKPDDMNSKHYPMRKIPYGYASHKLCIMCGYFNAVWVTVGNEFVPHDPAFFCDHCFYSYNFVDGKKICNFTTYPLLERKQFPVKVAEPVSKKPSGVQGGSKDTAHPLLFTPKNIHRELVVNAESSYPANN